jgi:SpoVK/Ycf46/Vps4 family AAA+-type ATPase
MLVPLPYCFFRVGFLTLSRASIQILIAVSRKLTLAPSVDFDELAYMTEGFSGADLQALVYNAHLEVVHATIDAEKASNDGRGDVEVGRRSVGAGQGGNVPVKYVVLGAGKDAAKGASKADEAKVQQRVRSCALFSSMFMTEMICSCNKSGRRNPG